MPSGQDRPAPAGNCLVSGNAIFGCTIHVSSHTAARHPVRACACSQVHRHTIVTGDNSSPTDRTVVPFRPRSGARPRLPPADPSPVESLARYEGGEDDGSYRHRMWVNLAAFAFTVLLAGAGIWLAIQLSDIRKTQDCFLSGRRNCAPIDDQTLAR